MESPSGQNVPLRSRNRRTIMTIRQIREAAQALQKSDPRSSAKPDPITRTSTQEISSFPKSSPVKQKSDSLVKLPEKHQILDDFFNGLDSSIRLLVLKGSASTFGNIISKVESLTDRRFTSKHLAQLKFILPEAFEIRKVFVRDERTNCMKPDLHIILNAKLIEEKENGKSEGGNGMLRKIFRARLVDFVNTYPEGDEVPAASLPKPFDEPSATISPLKYSTLLPSTSILETPTKDAKSSKSEDCSVSPTASTQGTPAHLVLTPAKLMTTSCSLQPLKRCNVTPDSYKSPDKLARRPSRSRSLNFDTNVDDDMDNGHSTIDADTLDILPQDLLDSIREKERNALRENDPAISQAKWRQKMIAKLPKFFDMVYFLFQSIKRSVITKEELVQKILCNNVDIIDKREVEEHLALLQELVPEWIFEKSASSGDLLFRINKILSPQSIRSRIAEAK